MKSLSRIYFLVFMFFSLLLDASEERILTLPKAGTHFLKKIIENITSKQVIPPTTPSHYEREYKRYSIDENTIVMGHCEPLVLSMLSSNERILLLIRDPRDVALSAVDYIDNHGLIVWPGLQKIVSQRKWNQLSKIEKLSLILEEYYDSRKLSVVTMFEMAITLITQKNCFIVKYEELSPEHNDFSDLSKTIQNIACFFGVELDDTRVEEVIEKSFRNKKCLTLNKGRAFRYLEEDREIVDFLSAKLKKYIDFYEFSL